MPTEFLEVNGRLMAKLDSDTYVPAAYLINPVTAAPVGTWGDASAAKQDEQTTELTSVNTNLTSLTSALSSSTAIRTDVPDSASSVTILAANAARKGASIYNDSSAILYLLYGNAAVASATNFTTKLNPGDRHEVEGGFVGILTGIWASDAGGNARVTELT